MIGRKNEVDVTVSEYTEHLENELRRVFPTEVQVEVDRLGNQRAIVDVIYDAANARHVMFIVDEESDAIEVIDSDEMPLVANIDQALWYVRSRVGSPRKEPLTGLIKKIGRGLRRRRS